MQDKSPHGEPVPGDLLAGFGNEHASEALPGALPIGQNTPQRLPYGLYAEQLTGTAFTAPRAENRRTWLYRIRPSALHPRFREMDHEQWLSAPLAGLHATPNRMRWKPQLAAADETDFVQAMRTIVATGDAEQRNGSAMHVYTATRAMDDRAFANHDGEMLIIPYAGALALTTELGRLHVAVGEIAVIGRGIKFRVTLPEGHSHGFVCENYGQPLSLPALGPVGSNGLANPRDFLAPGAWYEDSDEAVELVVKFGGKFWVTELAHSPFDVVAWHGTHVPYKYDLARFQVMNSVNFDHPDPSIFTVLTSASGLPGIANVEFVVFPPRWMVSEHTFRPPWFHRNIMSEFAFMIRGGASESRSQFPPGAHTLHNSLAAHGPDPAIFQHASTVELGPERQDGFLGLVESRLPFRVSAAAANSDQRIPDYDANWNGLPKHFDPSRR